MLKLQNCMGKKKNNPTEKCFCDFGSRTLKYWKRSQWISCKQLAQQFLEVEGSLPCKIYR